MSLTVVRLMAVSVFIIVGTLTYIYEAANNASVFYGTDEIRMRAPRISISRDILILCDVAGSNISL